jgi:hypothetical protein
MSRKKLTFKAQAKPAKTGAAEIPKGKDSAPMKAAKKELKRGMRA